MKTLDDLRKELSPAQRKRVDARTAQIIAEELTLQGLRKAQHKTQNQVAKTLGMSQDQISRLEQRSDLLLSTLRKFIEGMGGQLSLVAEFPDREPVRLSGLANIELPPQRRTRKPVHV